jgi:hypothetical protein
VNVKEISERIRALIAGRYGERRNDAAAGLGISELELTAILYGRGPTPSADRLAAILTRVVRHFGVDPSWLVTGRYDVRSHLAAEEGADSIALRFQIHRLLSGPDWSVATHPIERADRPPVADATQPALEWAEAAHAPFDSNSDHTDGHRGRGEEPDR